MKKFLNIFLLISSFVSNSAFTQMHEYAYKRSIQGIRSDWHKIILPEGMFGKIQSDMSDIRIYGVTPSKDTIEAPYVWRRSEGLQNAKTIHFSIINRSSTPNGFFYTFEVPTEEAINRIMLDFSMSNYDLRIRLEGSMDQRSWFKISDNNRVVSLENQETNFTYSSITFPDSKFKYYRIFVPSVTDPGLQSANLMISERSKDVFHSFGIEKQKVTHEQESTFIDLKLKNSVPISRIRFDIQEKFDYFRPIEILYVRDSVQTEKGWKHIYETLLTDELSSLEPHEFHFNSTIIQTIRIIIHNDNNQKLSPQKFEVSGFEYALIARFTEKATYYLVYGNEQAEQVNYDIARFESKIPNNSMDRASTVSIGEEILIQKNISQPVEPLFKNPWWLWTIMGLIILLMGWFLLKMLRNTHEN